MSYPPPKVVVRLTPGAGQTPVDITAYLSQESAPLLTTTIENPVETNNFTAADVTFKGYDPTGYVKGLFAAMSPTSTDFAVLISLGLWDPVALAYNNDKGLDGFVAPSTVSFDSKTKAFSFTIVGKARNLQTTSATLLFQRAGYYDGKWALSSDVSALDIYAPKLYVARTDGVPQSAPDFQPGDTVQILTNEKFIVTAVYPDPSTSPPVYWTLLLATPPKSNYPYVPANPTYVNLLTPYQRNVALHDVVAALFTAAGFPNEQYFFSAALPNLGRLFASPMSLTGFPAAGTAIVNPKEATGWIAVSAANGTYYATSATSGWTLYSNAGGFRQPIVDATNYGPAVSTTMFGVKRGYGRVGNPKFGLNETYKFYAYDHLAGNKRYVLTVTMNTDAVVPPYSITTSLAYETCVAGTWVWGGLTPIGGIGITTTTSTFPGDLTKSLGIDVDPATGTVFFTDPQLVGAAGSALTINISSYQPAGAGYVANRVSGMNGVIQMTGQGRCVIFQTDGLLGQNPTANLYTLTAAGAMTLVSSVASNPYVAGSTLRFNQGDLRWYVLISDPGAGVQIQSFGSDALVPSSAYPAVTIAAPVPGTDFGPAVDLAVQNGVVPGGFQPCPMFALVGGTPVFLSTSGSGNIPYADMTDLSVADALQQLSVLVAGFFYLTDNGNYWVFRSRSSPMPLNTIGVNDQIDGDVGYLSQVSQQVFNRWVGYVRVQNENDETIFGEAGSAAYADTDYGITLKTRFVGSISYATALAQSMFNYVGAQKRWVEIERTRDGRVYETGRTFRCNVDGVNRTFQIIETAFPVCGTTVKVVGLEV